MTETYKDRLDRMHSVRALDRDVQSARVAFADAAIAIRDTGEGELPQDVVATGQLQGELERIAAGLSRRPGLTSRELAVAINEDRYMVAKRMSVLEARGVAKRGEIRECSESGKRAITWWPVAGGGVVTPEDIGDAFRAGEDVAAVRLEVLAVLGKIAGLGAEDPGCCAFVAFEADTTPLEEGEP